MSVRADCSSHFITILNRTKHKRKRKEKKRNNIAARSHTHVILSLKEKALGLNSKNETN